MFCFFLVFEGARTQYLYNQRLLVFVHLYTNPNSALFSMVDGVAAEDVQRHLEVDDHDLDFLRHFAAESHLKFLPNLLGSLLPVVGNLLHQFSQVDLHLLLRDWRAVDDGVAR